VKVILGLLKKSVSPLHSLFRLPANRINNGSVYGVYRLIGVSDVANLYVPFLGSFPDRALC